MRLFLFTSLRNNYKLKLTCLVVIVEELHSVSTKDKGISFTLRASCPLDLCTNLLTRCIPENDLACLLVSATENTQSGGPVCQLLALTSEGNASDMRTSD